MSDAFGFNGQGAEIDKSFKSFKDGAKNGWGDAHDNQRGMYRYRGRARDAARDTKKVIRRHPSGDKHADAGGRIGATASRVWPARSAPRGRLQPSRRHELGKSDTAPAAQPARSAFGIQRGADQVSKSGAKALLGDAVVAAGTGGGRARKAGKLYRITPPGPTRRAEFSRGFQGGMAGPSSIRRVRGITQGSRKAERVLLGDYRTAAYRAQASSPHPGVFRAGERAGRGSDFYVRHSMAINTGVTVGAGGALTAGGIGADHARARRRAGSHQISKGNKLGYALLGGAVTGATMGLTEIDRRIGNSYGANVSFKHSHRHPVRSMHAYSAANTRDNSQRLGRAAERLEGRAATASTPQKREYVALRVARTREAQNHANWLATVHNERAAGRGRKGARSIGSYDKSRRYSVPAVIGKSAFGVEHSLVSKRNTNKDAPSYERLAAGVLFPGWHGAVAGKKGRKLKAVGHELGGAVAGAVVVPGLGGLPGAAVGTHFAHRKGYYKPDRGTQRARKATVVAKADRRDAFGVVR